MNNITFGQYIPGSSWIYKLDPRVKIILTILAISIIFIIPDLVGILILLGLFLIMFLTTKISLIRVLKGLRPVLFLLLFTVVLQLIYTKGTPDTLLYTFDLQIGLFNTLIILGILLVYIFTRKLIPFKLLYLLLMVISCFTALWLIKFDEFVWSNFVFDVYKEGLNNSAFIFIRISMVIGITSLLTFSTMTTDINNGLEAVLSPLKIFKIPVGVFSMLIALTLRFIPTLLEESKKIMNAQASRGVDFEEGTLKEKVTQIISLLIPMFVISFKRAEDLADAMEARGYIIEGKRTSVDELKLKTCDYVSIVVVGILLVLSIGWLFI